VTTDVLSDQVLQSAGGTRPVDPGGDVRNLIQLVETVERQEIAKALERSQGNKTRAADLLGISRFTLQRNLEKYVMTSP
ncbi:MAG: helix-turn-helix domain-containing protein, partial [Planctomycetota bacterium]